MASARLLFGRRDDPDIIRKLPRDGLKRDQTGGVDAVIIGKENAH